MQTVSDKFRTKAYSGEALYHTILQIDEQEVPIEQISSIEIDSPIVDNTSESFYLGTFISQSLKIKFKNLDGLNIASNKEVYLQIGEERESYNLLNTQNIEPSTISGLNINLDNTLLSLNGSNSDAGYIIPSNTDTGIVLNEGNYLLSVTILAGDVNFGSSNTVVYIKNYNTNTTLGSASIKSAYNNTNKVQVSGTIEINEPTNIGFEIYTNGVVEYSSLKVGIQLQKGTEETPYEPFGNIIEYVPIGRFLIDDLAEDYFETCEITCLDYAVKLKPNIDYSPCFTRQSEEDTPTATVQTIFNYICDYFGIEVETDISNLPNINVEVGTFDGSISGKQWISYLAEIMGCNAKINRDGKLILIPLKHEKSTTINALESEEFTLGEKYEISRVVYFDAVRNFTYGEDIHNTLFIRQDNPFIVDGNVVENIYNTLFDYSPKTSNKSELISIDDGNDDIPAKITMYGNTYQEENPEPENPKEVQTVTGELTLDINSEEKSINLGNIELCKIGDYQDYIRKSTGKNLFDKDNANIINCYCNNNGIISNNNARGVYIQCSPNTTYTIQKNGSARFRICTTVTEPSSGVGKIDLINNDNAESITITTSNDANYLFIYFYLTSDANEKTEEEVLDTMQIEENDYATDYEPFGEVWYKRCEIGKFVFNGTENWQINENQTLTNTLYFSTNRLDSLINVNSSCLSNYFNTNLSLWNNDKEGLQLTSSSRNIRVRINKNALSSEDVTGFTEWLSTHNTEVYYVLATPIVEIISNETLIAQLESALRPTLLNGNNTITTTNDLKPYLQMDYISKNYFKIWSLQTKNYGDISLDAWDIIEYTLGEDEYHNPITYQTYNNNHINYEMNIASEVNTQIPTKQREITTNIYDNNEEVRVKMIKTLLDYVNAEVILQAEEQREQSRRLTQLRLDIESIQNIFQITGGSNLITNSQFLFDDPIDNETQLRTYWNFTNNGSNPYQNIGSGFDGSLAGQTTSVAKIQLRDIIAETSSANIIGLKEGQTYTLNYSYKQDELTTTNFQLIDSNNNVVTYSILNEETGLYEDKDIDFNYNSEETNYKYETIQFTAPTSSLILKITTNTLSGDTNSGYFYLYDLMLNSGDKKTWEPAKSEVYSTVLKMSQLGLQVMATGSNIATLINADGFRIFKLNGNNLGEEITTFNDKGLITGIAETDEVHTGNYVMTEIQINNTEHHVEYFKERN